MIKKAENKKKWTTPKVQKLKFSDTRGTFQGK